MTPKANTKNVNVIQMGSSGPNNRYDQDQNIRKNARSSNGRRNNNDNNNN